MINKEELTKTPEYWLETIQNEIFRLVNSYLKENKMSQTQFAVQLGVSKGYVSQIMKGEFNYTLKKMIELSLAVGKAPVLEFQPLNKIMKATKNGPASAQNNHLDQVAEPDNQYE
jgi:transcriptional regulator with XRE-family HTH domain